jgi:hypothetical protein
MGMTAEDRDPRTGGCAGRRRLRMSAGRADRLAERGDLADGLAPESAALVLVWENSWAARFAAAIRDSHGRGAMLERIPRHTSSEQSAHCGTRR